MSSDYATDVRAGNLTRIKTVIARRPPNAAISVKPSFRNIR